MSIYANLKQSDDMGIDRAWAINSRQRFLTQALFDVNDALSAWGKFVAGFDPISATEVFMISEEIGEVIERKCGILKELEAIKKMTKDPKDVITDEMVEEARRYPVDRLVSFSRGKAVAWCHPDKNPSLTYMTRTGKAWCPVCGRYFNAVDILMDRDGYTFKDAVKELCTR